MVEGHREATGGQGRGALGMTDQEQFIADCNEQFQKVVVIVNDWLKTTLGPEPLNNANVQLKRYNEPDRDTWAIYINGKQYGNPLTIDWRHHR